MATRKELQERSCARGSHVRFYDVESASETQLGWTLQFMRLVIVLTVAFAAAIPLVADTETMDSGYTWTYRITDGEAEITSGGTSSAVSPQSGSDISIPTVLGGCPVTRIGDYALKGIQFSSLTIHEGVKSIGNYAFCGIGCVSYVVLPESLARIGAYAFSSNDIGTVTVPQGVTEIGNYAFAGSEVGRIRLSKIWDGKLHETVFDKISLTEEAYYTVGTPCTVSFIKSINKPCAVCQVEVLEERVVKCGEAIGTLPELPLSEGAWFAGWWVGQGGACSVCAPDQEVKRIESTTVIYGDVSVSANWTTDRTWYALSGSAGDRTIITIDVSAGTVVPSFVLQDGRVYDRMLRVVNATANDVRLTLPLGYSYEKFKGTDPLLILHSTTNMLSITRTADKLFLVSREEVEQLK